MTQQIWTDSYFEYLDYMTSKVDDYLTNPVFQIRRDQIETVLDSIKEFPFDQLIAIETGASQNLRDGAFGLFLAKVAEKSYGRFSSVDIFDDKLQRSRELVNDFAPSTDYITWTGDSVKYLETENLNPNFVHLDSADLDLINPLPSMLHHWREFIAIEKHMPVGSIIVIDDNYPKGTWVQWFFTDGRMENISINYPMVGKGALIYHYVQWGISNWKLLGNHYTHNTNIKIILQKIK